MYECIYIFHIYIQKKVPRLAKNTIIDVTQCVNNGKYLQVHSLLLPYRVLRGQLEKRRKTCLFLLMNSVRTRACSKSDACLFAIRKRLRLENYRNKLSRGEENRLIHDIPLLVHKKLHTSKDLQTRHHVCELPLWKIIYSLKWFLIMTARTTNVSQDESKWRASGFNQTKIFSFTSPSVMVNWSIPNVMFYEATYEPRMSIGKAGVSN